MQPFATTFIRQPRLLPSSSCGLAISPFRRSYVVIADRGSKTGGGLARLGLTMEIGELLAIWRAHSGASPHPTACRNGRQKSPQARASTGVPLEDTRARRSHLAGSLLFPTLMGPYIISVDLSGPASSPFVTLMTDMETRPHCIASSITAKRAAHHHLPPFTCGDGLQISLKILKIVLCSDFLGFHVIHHFPE